MKKFLLILPFLFAAPALAAENAAQPVTISAQKSLEWNRKAKTYTAREDVIATQGDVTLRSDTLTAHYADDNGGAADIRSLEAEGNVSIAAPPYTAHGEHAVYDVKTGRATLTGKGLKITSLENVLTAEDRIEYDSKKNTMTAVGSPTVTGDQQTLTADTMDAWFSRDAEGKLTAHKITARGHVSIKRVTKAGTETAVGDEGVYDIPARKAVLTGKVRILQGENWIEGTRADVDMTTGISRLSGTGNAATEGRVTGTFYPQPKKKTGGQ